MSIYRFSGASDVTEVRFRYASDRPPVALLSAGAVAPEKLSAIRSALESAGWQCVPAFADGRDVLQVSGFADAPQLTTTLLKLGIVQGVGQIEAEAHDRPRRNLKEWVQHYSLKGAGIFNLIGDAGLLFDGINNKNYYHTGAGALYTTGAANAALFGAAKTEDSVKETLEQTNDLFSQQGIDTPRDANLYQATHEPRETLQSTKRSLRQHAAQTMLGFYTLGAATMLGGGIAEKNPSKIAYGLSSLGLKATSFALPEKSKVQKKEEDAENSSIPSQIGHWFIDKPMRLFGIGSFLSDSFLAHAAWEAYKLNPEKNKNYFLITTTISYFVGDILAALASKDASNADGKFSAEQERRMEASAAEVIARAPETQRDGLSNQVAAVISQRAESGGDAEKISRSIREQVLHMAKNPWVNRVNSEAFRDKSNSY